MFAYKRLTYVLIGMSVYMSSLPLKADETADLIGAIITGVLGGALNANKEARLKEWTDLDPQRRQCFQEFYDLSGNNLREVIHAGISPNDKRFDEINGICDRAIKVKLKNSFFCEQELDNGKKIGLECTEKLIAIENGKEVSVSALESILLADSGMTVKRVSMLTESSAVAVRLQNEKIASDKLAKEAEERRLEEK